MFYKIIGEKCFSRAKWRQAVVCVICLLLLFSWMLICGGCHSDGEAILITGGVVGAEIPTGVTEKLTQEQSAADATIYVHVCGQVAEPGLYLLLEGSRVWDAVEAAGGFLPEAAQEAVNLAMKVTDGSKVTIPHQREAEESDFHWYEADGSVGETRLIDINRATVTELMSIPGIGQTRAEAIVSHRENRGPFTVIEEIMQVTGIKEGLFSKIKEYITVGG